METKKFVQFGTFPIVILGIPLIILPLKSYESGFLKLWALFMLAYQHYWIGSVAIGISLFFFIYTIKNDAIEVNTDNLVISGIYSKSIDYSQIVKIDTISTLPKSEARTNGSYLMGQA
jgi:hypothetical protein